ncbi:uncharacterized protein N7511_003067 [Penicillium nucicola]|uniref:uncharacterized protein n=1 Tax=Penicillium nucicola TaxID=1850975 RepID=UPI00254556DF|nr:uncharacterized protein N7511_003067 [Penicillium nucicola]KAJ5771016.1 hypothetical protein N7511_003067 [Penicillium nucicola]
MAEVYPLPVGSVTFPYLKAMLATRAAAHTCKEVTPECPLGGTIYGYAPDYSTTVEFAVIFAICCLVQLVQMFRWRLWSFSICVILGALTEGLTKQAGYFGRILLNQNPYSSIGFQTQIVTLTLAPAFWSAAMYLTLKHEVNVLGPQYSLIQSKLYPYIFVTCDIVSLTLQGAGGGISATAKTTKMIDMGSHIMMAGIVWQVVTLTVFAMMSAQFLWRIRSAPKETLTFEAQRVWKSSKFWSFFWGIAIAFSTTYVRCIYRIVEMSDGWRNKIMQDEFSFTLFESAMCVAAVVALCIAHPGYLFKEMRRDHDEESMVDLKGIQYREKEFV